ncbi:MAG: hypothetical protein ABIK86_00675 [candidate division WOR-3 bacterium]
MSESQFTIISLDPTLGIEQPSREAGTSRREPLATVIRGVLYLRPSPFPLPVGEGQEVRGQSLLLDVAGRQVMELRPGANDIRHLAPGVYFVCSGPSAAVGRTSSGRKVVIAE